MRHRTGHTVTDSCTWCAADNVVMSGQSEYVCQECGLITVRFGDWNSASASADARVRRPILAADHASELQTEYRTCDDPAGNSRMTHGRRCCLRTLRRCSSSWPRMSGRRSPCGNTTSSTRCPYAGSPSASTKCTGTRICVVTGPGGIGKTTLAVHAAHRLREHYPVGQLYTDLGGAYPSAASATAVLAGSSLTSARTQPSFRAMRPDWWGATAATRLTGASLSSWTTRGLGQLRLLLPSGPRCGTIIASRYMLVDLAGACRFPLDTFAGSESLSQFSRIVGQDRVGAEADATERLLGMCGGLPLAVRVAAERLSSRAHWTLGQVASRLADESGRFDELAAGDL